MTKVLKAKYLRNLCKERGWDYNLLIQNEEFVKGVNKIQRTVDKIVKETTKKILAKRNEEQQQMSNKKRND